MGDVLGGDFVGPIPFKKNLSKCYVTDITRLSRII